jgi:arsenical pump membrane protein
VVLSGIDWRAGPAAAAAFGVVVLLAAQIVTPADLAGGFQVLWRPFLAIVSIMLTANVARRLGILDNFARAIEPRPGQSVGRVFGLAFILSAITSAALNNDAAVLLLTPLIVGLVRRCYPHRPDLIIPFAFAVFSAAGVAPLVISNPMNLIVAEYAGIGFNEYAARMVPIAIVGWVTAYAILFVMFRQQLRSPERGVAERVAVPMPSQPAKQFLGLMVVALGWLFPTREVRCGQSLPRPRRWACGCAGETASPPPRNWPPRYRGRY